MNMLKQLIYQKTCGNSIHYGNGIAACNQVLQSARVNLGGFNVYNIDHECYLENDELVDDLKEV